MSIRKLTLTLLLSLLSFAVVSAYNLEKQLVLVLPDTSYEQWEKADLSFGPGDDYCYYIPGNAGLLINNKTCGPFLQESKHKPFIFYDVKNEERYIKSINSAILYGPYKGAVQTIDRANVFEGSLVYTVIVGDSISYYINGKKIAAVSRSADIDRSHWPNWWFAFSHNGNYLYTVKKGEQNYLFVNGRLTDSSRYYYGRLIIDNSGSYSYMLGNLEKEGRFYNFKSIAHKNSGTFNRVGTGLALPWYIDAYRATFVYRSDDTINYYGNSDGVNYLTTGHCSKLPEQAGATTIVKGKTIFSCRSGAMHLAQIPSSYYPPDTALVTICINDNRLNLPYEGISYPVLDSFGHYALFGTRDYYMYKNINGVEQGPLSKHGVRAKPISLDIQGNTICYYETDDSVYVYENDRLFGVCSERNFELDPQDYSWDYNSGYGKLPVFNMGNSSYIVYKNTISPALLKIKSPSADSGRIGMVISAKINEHGYWLIQKTGYKKYDLFINNQKIALPPGIGLEYELNSYIKLTAGEFSFYSKEGNGIFRYKLRL